MAFLRHLMIGLAGLAGGVFGQTPWTNLTTSTPSQGWLKSVTWTGSQLVAVGELGAILTSPDGVQWSDQSSETLAGLRSVTWGRDRLVAVGDPAILSSRDGIQLSLIHI